MSASNPLREAAMPSGSASDWCIACENGTPLPPLSSSSDTADRDRPAWERPAMMGVVVGEKGPCARDSNRETGVNRGPLSRFFSP